MNKLIFVQVFLGLFSSIASATSCEVYSIPDNQITVKVAADATYDMQIEAWLERFSFAFMPSGFPNMEVSASDSSEQKNWSPLQGFYIYGSDKQIVSECTEMLFKAERERRGFVIRIENATLGRYDDIDNHGRCKYPEMQRMVAFAELGKISCTLD